MKKISIISPVYNESESLPAFYKELIKYLPDNIYNFEIILVNDGSTDKTADIIRRLASKDMRLKYIFFDKNYGQQQAILCGLKHCTGQAAIVMDSDLQDPPSLIKKMIRRWQDGADIVLPVRKSRKDNSLKTLLAEAFYLLLNSTQSTKLNSKIGDFYLINRPTIDLIINSGRQPSFLRGEVQKIHLKKDNVYYDRQSRRYGKSSYSIIKMIKLGASAFGYRRHRIQSELRIKVVESNIFNKKIAIIGAGISGLICAYRLSKLGYIVTLFEKDAQVGGLAASTELAGMKVDKYYHHIFPKQVHILALYNELGIYSDLQNLPTSMACIKDNVIYPFNNAKDLLGLPFYSLQQKILLGFGNLRTRKISPKNISHITAKELIRNIMGTSAWNDFWRPVFKSKFGVYSDKISASWFVMRITNRGKNIMGEHLIYPKGGFGKLINTLVERVYVNGGTIKTSNLVKNIKKRQSYFVISNEKYDYCISTIAPEKTAEILPHYNPSNISYLGVVGLIVALNKKFSLHYWINILDCNAPFGVIVEQNNLAPPSSRAQRSGAEGSLCDHHILYLGKYTKNSSVLYNLPNTDIAKIGVNWLEKIKPGIKDEIIETKIFKDSFAQPIITTNYKKPSHTIKDIDGFYTTSMAHIFPEDRGLENAVIEANKICWMIINNRK
jgi:protoporphyrinogen oxidase